MFKSTILVIIVAAIASLAISAYGEEVSVSNYVIDIVSNQSSISVTENIRIDTNDIELVEFWIQSEATGVSILIDNEPLECSILDGNIYVCNISGIDVKNKTIVVKYNLSKDVNEFKKTLQYNTSQLSINFDGKEIYSGSNLKSGSSLNVVLQRPIQETKEVIPTLYYAILIIFIIIVILLLILCIKSRTKTPLSKKELATESEELLLTKKELLMEVLKDIEKKHRAKQISDDTYNKLKDHYKQEAVEAMKRLEDLKSKVK